MNDARSINFHDSTYNKLVLEVLRYGVIKEDRTGTGTKSSFGKTVTFYPREYAFPLMVHRKLSFKNIVSELLWFLKGRTDLRYLLERGNHIWVGDAYKNYLENFTPPVCPPNLDVQPDYYEPLSKDMFIHGVKTDDEFAKKWGDLGPIYGRQWRNWKFTDKFTNGQQMAYVNGAVDQIQNLIKELTTNPDSRRLIVNSWNVGELDQMILPPCHRSFQLYSALSHDKKYRSLSMLVDIRSNDLPLGAPYNIASYSLLLLLFCKLTTADGIPFKPERLVINIGDAHIYLDQVEIMGKRCIPNITKIEEENIGSPTLKIHEDASLLDIDSLDESMFQIEDYHAWETISIPLSN